MPTIRLIFLLLCLASFNALSATDDIVLLCTVSGTETLSSNKYPTNVKKTPVWQGSYIFSKNQHYGWTASINGEPPIRYVDTSKDKDLKRVSSVSVGDQLLEVSDKFWSTYWSDKDTKEKGTLTLDYTLSINRITGIISEKNYLQIDYESGFISKSTRQLSGKCESSKPKF